MHDTDRQRVLDLLSRLKRLETAVPAPEEEAIHQVARQAIVDEISRLVHADSLAVYRNGDGIDVVSLA